MIIEVALVSRIVVELSCNKISVDFGLSLDSLESVKLVRLPANHRPVSSSMRTHFQSSLSRLAKCVNGTDTAQVLSAITLIQPLYSLQHA
jgi:hypothetical protein